jgi:hypothetical protein
MEHAEFIGYVRRQVAELAVGASTLRNQGGSGLVRIAREHFKQVNLTKYSSANNQDEFSRLLDDDTDKLMRSFPPGAQQNWGAARKAMNLFLRNSTYNRFLFHEFGLARIEKWLEVPLDNDVAKGLISDFQNGKFVLPTGTLLPDWKNIKSLKQEENKLFQNAAQALADSKGIARVHVDLLYWRTRTAEQTDSGDKQ